jgi:hypothetical protein
MMTYAAQVEDGTVVQVIVGTAEWAASRLGGMWVGSDVKVGIGWLVVDGKIVPPPTPEASPDQGFTGDLL